LSVVFSAPAALAGLAASALPIVIHLINRRRVKDLVFPPTALLLEIARRRSRSLILQHWLLLLIRTLIIAILVTSVAGPVWRRPVPLLSALPQSGRVALILDDSLSTGYRLSDGRSLFDSLRGGAAGLIDGAGPGTVLSVTTSSALVSSGLPIFTGKEAARRALADLPPGFGNAGAAAVVRSLAEAARKAPLQAWILTDDTARPWEGFNAGDLGPLAGSLDLRLLLFPLPADAANLAVIDAQALPGGGVAVKVVSGGRIPVSGRQLAVTIGVTTGERFVIDLPPGASRLVPVTPPGGGDRIKGSAEADADPLTADDRFLFLLSSPPSRPVLLLNGRQAPAGPNRPDFFLAQALAPGERIAPPATIVPREAAEGLPGDLSPFGAIILAEPPTPNPAEWNRLQAFVEAGGGLLLYPSAALAAASPAGPASRLAPGLPFTAKRYDPPGRITPVTLEDPLLTSLGTDGPAMLADTAVRAVFVPQGLPPGWETLLATDRGDPLLVRTRVGKGSVCWFLSPSGIEGSDLPLRPVFLPLVQGIVRGIAAAGEVVVSYKREASPARWLGELAVNPPGDEWNLAPITRERVTDLLADLPGPVAVASVSDARELVPSDRDLVLPLLLLLVLLLLAEGWLSERRLADES
jgi:hypothetical protein